MTNTGARAGKELVQFYVCDLGGSLTRPVRELKGFQNEKALAFTRTDGTKGVEPGTIHVWIAPDSESGLQGSFRL